MIERKLYKSRAGGYGLKYPPDWEIEEGNECVTIYDPRKGLGALQASAYRTPTPQNPKDVLLEYLSDNDVPIEEKEIILHKTNGKTMASYEYIEGPWYKKVWFISQDSCLLLVTYNCKVEHKKEEEIDKVEEIVHSIIVTTGGQ